MRRAQWRRGRRVAGRRSGSATSPVRACLTSRASRPCSRARSAQPHGPRRCKRLVWRWRRNPPCSAAEESVARGCGNTVPLIVLPARRGRARAAWPPARDAQLFGDRCPAHMRARAPKHLVFGSQWAHGFVRLPSVPCRSLLWGRVDESRWRRVRLLGGEGGACLHVWRVRVRRCFSLRE